MGKGKPKDKLRRAKGLGFCPGVRRALRLAEEALRENKKVYVIGDLIHNEGEMERLKSLGLRIVEDVEDIPDDGYMLVRAHGSPPELIKKAAEKGIKIIDCTCSRVRKAQLTALKLLREGRAVLIFGDKEHPEVQGILGYINGQGMVIESEEEAIDFPPERKTGLLCQTTKGGNKFLRIASLLASKLVDFKFEDTSCPEVEKRRRASQELAKEVDIMVIVGGKRSANTKRLKEACEEMGVKSYLVERADDVREEWFGGDERVGITAGLSTPLWEVEEIERKIADILEKLWRRKSL